MTCSDKTPFPVHILGMELNLSGLPNDAIHVSGLSGLPNDAIHVSGPSGLPNDAIHVSGLSGWITDGTNPIPCKGGSFLFSTVSTMAVGPT
jgi:hypothetical protein